MGGWTGKGRDTIHWDGTIEADNFIGDFESAGNLFVNVTGDTMTGTLILDGASTNLEFTGQSGSTSIKTNTIFKFDAASTGINSLITQIL